MQASKTSTATGKPLLRVAELLGTGERGRYLLAATFGNVHGVYAPGHVKLRPEILRDGQEALAAARPGTHSKTYSTAAAAQATMTSAPPSPTA